MEVIAPNPTDVAPSTGHTTAYSMMTIQAGDIFIFTSWFHTLILSSRGLLIHVFFTSKKPTGSPIFLGHKWSLWSCFPNAVPLGLYEGSRPQETQFIKGNIILIRRRVRWSDLK